MRNTLSVWGQTFWQWANVTCIQCTCNDVRKCKRESLFPDAIKIYIWFQKITPLPNRNAFDPSSVFQNPITLFQLKVYLIFELAENRLTKTKLEKIKLIPWAFALLLKLQRDASKGFRSLLSISTQLILPLYTRI